ncbi:MAG: SDR family oxidoreductase [bacterium]|nr:SDR family oxidoreductase [bacterium]
MNYTRSVALITGASSGIGLALAKELHKKGYNLLLTARREALLDSISSELNQIRENSVRFIVADLTELNSSQGGLHEILSYISNSQVDILFNNAGFGSFGYLEELSLLDQEKMIYLNIIAPLKLCHAVIPKMKLQGRGKIVNISSLAGFQPIPYMSTYSGTKAFDFMFSLSLRHELKKFGIDVITVCPGPVDTEFAGVARVPGTATGVGRDKVESVALDILKGIENNTEICIPGLQSKVINLLMKVIPLRLKNTLIEYFLRAPLMTKRNQK